MKGNSTGDARKAATTVLVTGFGPFPGVPVNATIALVDEVMQRAPRLFPAVRFASAVLATEWLTAPQRLDCLLRQYCPDLVLHFGVSARARGLEIEWRARNGCSPAPDALGALPPDAAFTECGAEHLLSSLPVHHIAARLRHIGIAAFVSRDAGAYLCNALLYRSLFLARALPHRRVGFIHIPAALARRSFQGRSGCPLTWEQAIAGAIAIVAICLGRPLQHRLGIAPGGRRV